MVTFTRLDSAPMTTLSATNITTRPARRRLFTLVRAVGMVSILAVLLLVGRVLAQSAPTGTPAVAAVPSATSPAPTGGGESRVTLMSLFMQSFDLFTILLVIGSLAGWTIIIVCILEIRRSTIAPDEPPQIIGKLARQGSWPELRQFLSDDDALVSRIVRAAHNVPVDDRNAMREAAELCASEESSRWFRKLEPLNVIGNLGPLLGLAGTVWGMIIAFAALGESGGQANPATLSLGISKALFHTLLGLMLAVPCLTVFGFYRSMVDKFCTRAIVQASDLVELLPLDARTRLGNSAAKPGPTNQPRPAPTPPTR